MNGKPVRIVPSKQPDDGKYLISQGTQLWCGDQEICGITNISVHFAIDDVVRAEVELFVAPDEIPGALAKYYMIHPLTGENVQLKALIFADDSRLDL